MLIPAAAASVCTYASETYLLRLSFVPRFHCSILYRLSVFCFNTFTDKSFFFQFFPELKVAFFLPDTMYTRPFSFRFRKHKQRFHRNFLLIHSQNFTDLKHLPGSIPHPSKVHQNINCRSNLPSDSSYRKLHASHQRHRFQAQQHVPAAICMTGAQTSIMAGIQCLYMDSLCSHHAEIQYLHLIYTVYNVIILPFHSCKKKREPFTALFHIDFLIHLSYLTVWQPMSLNFFPKMGQSLVLHQMPSQLLSFAHILLQIPMQIHNSKHLSE